MKEINVCMKDVNFRLFWQMGKDFFLNGLSFCWISLIAWKTFSFWVADLLAFFIIY